MMNAAFISIGISLVALAVGMFLMAKTNKENLGIFYTIVAYFIIISSLLNLACTVLSCTIRFYSKHHLNEGMMHKKSWKKKMDYHHGGGHYYHRTGMSDHSQAMSCCDKECCYKNCYEKYYNSRECIDPGPDQLWQKEKHHVEIKDSVVTKE